MEIRVARNGKEIGTFDEKSLAEAITKGTVKRDDLAWYAGLDTWLPVSDFIAPPTPPPIPKKAKKPKGKYAATKHYTLKEPAPPVPSDVRDWTQDRATLKQLRYIKEFGAKADASMTKGQAGVILDRLINELPKIAEAHERAKANRKADPVTKLKEELAEAERQLKAARGRANIEFHRDSVRFLKKRLKEERGSSGCGCLVWVTVTIVLYALYLLLRSK